MKTKIAFSLVISSALACLFGISVASFLPVWASILTAAITGTVIVALLFHAFYLRSYRAALNALCQGVITGTEIIISEQSNSDSIHPLYRTAIEKLNALKETRIKLSENGSRIAIASAEVSFAADMLEKKVHEEVAEANSIAESINRISLTVDDMARLTTNAADSAMHSRDLSQDGQKTTREITGVMDSTQQKAEHTAAVISSLETKSNQILEISKVISDIADQTNLLALNAAIEAARAGDQGRGFAVVADEVRNLAQRTGESTDEIQTTVNEIYQEVGKAGETIRDLVMSIHNSADSTKRIDEQLHEILQQSDNVSTQISGISQGAEENAAEIEQISSAVQVVSGHLGETEEKVEAIAKQSISLADMAEFIHDVMAGFDLNTIHDHMRQIAAQASKDIQKKFEDAIEKGIITESDLFDRNYRPIENTKPTKYKTRFDDFTDKILPTIQEPILEKNKAIYYAGAVDNKGYFPTHNKKYSQPLTGNYEIDLVNNRTKRIFTDRVGSRCGSNTKEFLLQTYKRDTGEVLHDISVPIYIHSKHWGGFRMGYKAAE
jgi:methyl-accepting chemotaxis protein